MKHFTMKDFQTHHPAVATDSDGSLFNPTFREALQEHVEPPALRAVEAFAALRWAAKLAHHRMERWAEKQGLSEGRLQVLFRLRHQADGVPLGELAEILSVSPRNVTGLIDNLERDGLVTRVPDPADRRSVLAKLTNSGWDRIESLWRAAVGRQAPMAHGLSEEELTQLRHLCLRLVESMRMCGEKEVRQ